MQTLSQIALLVAAVCPIGWITSLFYGEKGNLTVPGYNLPSAGFGLLAFFCLIQSVTIAAISSVSFRYEELREVSIVLVVAALASMTCFSLFSYVFANSRFARTGVWFGLVGFLALAAGQFANAV